MLQFKFFDVFVLLMVSIAFNAQTRGIAYQAVIYSPGAKSIPGVSMPASPLLNTPICLRFTFLDAVNNTEYQETVTTSTDNYGIVNTIIGLGSKLGGYTTSFDNISWNTNQKTLVVELDVTSNCSSFVEISNQLLTTAPFSYSAISANNITGIAAIVNGGTGSDNAIDARNNLGLGNVNNTSDLSKPISTAMQIALNNKEDLANKSTNIATDATSNVKYPTVKALKTYVDSQIAAGSVAAGGITTLKLADGAVTDIKIANGINPSKVGLGNVDNTSDLNKPVSTATQIALNLKENIANKSTATTLGYSDILFPTQNAVKKYVDNQVALTTIPDASSTLKGKIQLAGDLAGTGSAAATPIVGGIQGVPIATTSPTMGQILYFNGTSWGPTSAPAEVDAIIGNEVTDAVANGGLTRSGTGTAPDPYKLKINDGTVNGQLLTWDGSKWIAQTAAPQWALEGNVGTDPSTNFIGTADAKALAFRTNNTERLRVTSTGNVGIGLNTPTSLLGLNGPISTPIIITSSNVVLDNTHAVVKIDATLSDINITLPDPTTVNGRTYIIIKTDKSNNKLVFNQTITGNEFTFTQANVPGTYQLQSDGTNWNLIR